MMTAMRKQRRLLAAGILVPILLGLSCTLPLSMEVIATRTPSLTPTAVPSPSATPAPTSTTSPTPTAGQVLSRAEYARTIGDWESAIAEYERVAARSDDPGILGLARLGLGATHLLAGNYAQAIDNLTEFISEHEELERYGQAFFLRALAYEALEDHLAAARDYARYLDSRPGILDSYAHERAGDAHLSAENGVEAIPHYEAALDAPRLGGEFGISLKLGRALMQAGEWAQAVGVFDEVIASASDSETKATANLLAGRSLLAMGDQEAGYGRYLESVDQYPTAYDTYLGLVELVDAGIPVDDFQRGVVDYHAEAYGAALSALTRVLMRAPTPEAYYFRGLTLRELGDPSSAVHDFASFLGFYGEDPLRTDVWLEKALTEWAYQGDYAAGVNTYLAFVDENPDAPEAPTALFAAGRTAERGDELGQAAEIWLRLGEEYPESDQAYPGLFQAGVVLYRSEQYTLSRSALQRALSLAPDSGDRAAAYLWIGKTHAAESDTGEAESAWQAAAIADPTGYYSVRAEHLLEGAAPFEPPGDYDLTVDLEAERLFAEAWMRENFPVVGPEPLHGLDEQLRGDPRMIRGVELLQLGLFDQGRTELEALREQVEDDAEATYRLMHKFLDLGLYRSAILASRQVLRLAGMDDADTFQAPDYFNYVRFGPYYADIIVPEAESRGLHGLFVLSVVRQESLFEGFATSYAAARGLMQVIPSTGEEIADQLGWPPDYSQDDLYRPVVSARFGTYYLARQLDQFSGDPFAALAAYNGGPGNASAWHVIAPEDYDLFLEIIRLQQTHHYVRVIYEVYEIYQDLYAR